MGRYLYHDTNWKVLKLFCLIAHNRFAQKFDRRQIRIRSPTSQEQKEAQEALTRISRTLASPFPKINPMAESNPGPENLSDVLGRLFVARGWGRVSERTRLETAWGEAIGPELAGQTRVGGLRRGVLEIEVRSAVLQQELTQYHKRSLLNDLRTRLPGVSIGDLKFRSGVW